MLLLCGLHENNPVAMKGSGQ